MDSIQIQQGFTPEQRAAVAQIYCAAFSRKLTPVYGNLDIAQRILGDALNPRCCFVAVSEAGGVQGVAGFQHDHERFVNLSASALLSEFGIVQGILRYLLAAFFERYTDKVVFQMDGIAVHPEARGLGIGTRLIDALTEFARGHGYGGIRLDVVNSNPEARRLYEKLSFAHKRTHAYPFLRSLGFTAVTTMVKSFT